MIKTKFGSIVSHKFNNQYICYDSSIQPILKDRILASLESDEFRLSNSSNFLDFNNGLIKKHFWRKGLVSIFNDNYLYYRLRNTRPVRELMNYIDFSIIINNEKNKTATKYIELCTPIFSYIKKNIIFYKGDIILSKMSGDTLDKYILNKDYSHSVESKLASCFNLLFQNGIYNFDMNLKNIIFNKETCKFSFIDFDKILINTSIKSNEKYASLVISKFEKSLRKHGLNYSFDWKTFIDSLKC